MGKKLEMGKTLESGERKSKKGKPGILFRLGGVVLVLIVMLVVVTVYFYRSLTVQLFAERQLHLTEMTIKVSEVIDTTIESVQGKSRSARLLLEEQEIPDKKTLFEELARIADIVDVEEGMFLAMDSNGKYYSSDGREGRWEDVEDLVEKHTKPVIRDLMMDGEKISYMVFFGSLEKEKTLGKAGNVLSHTAVAIPLDSMKETLSISMFEDKCFAYLVNTSGRRLYKQTFSNKFIENFNILTALRECTFLMGGTFENLEVAIHNREQLCAEFVDTESGENYFVSTVPVSNSDWMVLLFVPTSILGKQTDNFMSVLILYFMGLAVIITIIFMLLMFAVVTNRNDRKMMLQKEEHNKQLAKAAEEARSASAAKTEFLSHMSHDIRTPINGIVGMTNIALKNTSDAEKVEDCLNKISGSADHLLTLINDVLDMSRIESGKIVIAHNPLDLRVLIDNCASIIGGQLISREVEFKQEIGEMKHPFLLGDELHLRQVFINILGNAVKFTPDGGTIIFRAKELSADDEKVQYRFEFEDNGIGMSEEFQTKIFEAFSQEDGGSRTTYAGTGLGMAITKQFVDLMQGTIEVRSRLNEGSCFTIELSFDIDNDRKEEVVQKETISIHGMKVLLVEDIELNMEIAKEILEEEGVTVTGAENGKIARDIFVSSQQGEFDVILMDIMMPVMDGFQATREIRESSHPEAKTIPIIAMTANAYDEDVQSALAAGMNAHIAKPINVHRLFSLLNQYKR
jgi:signal transduction histidine kinase/CheY-like chemotaxis protein